MRVPCCIQASAICSAGSKRQVIVGVSRVAGCGVLTVILLLLPQCKSVGIPQGVEEELEDIDGEFGPVKGQISSSVRSSLTCRFTSLLPLRGRAGVWQWCGP